MTHSMGYRGKEDIRGTSKVRWLFWGTLKTEIMGGRVDMEAHQERDIGTERGDIKESLRREH